MVGKYCSIKVGSANYYHFMFTITESGRCVSTVSKGQVLFLSCLGDRDEQQDSCLLRSSVSATLAVVADGAGGHRGGAAASAKVVEVLEAAWINRLAKGVSKEDAADVLESAIIEAHHAVIENGGDAVHSGKSTVVLLYIAQGYYTVMHVGDSRLYARRTGEWECRTDDDSLLHLLLLAGRVSPEEAKNHPDQSRLTQAVGGREVPEVHAEQGEYEPETEYLLCCDGFWNQLPDEEWLPENWPTGVGDAADVLENKVKAAYIGGQEKSDNVTAVWLCPGAAPAADSPQRRSFVLKIMLWVVGVILVFLFGCVAGFFLRGVCHDGLGTLIFRTSAENTANSSSGEALLSEPPMPQETE